jgi:hypothetical protein
MPRTPDQIRNELFAPHVRHIEIGRVSPQGSADLAIATQNAQEAASNPSFCAKYQAKEILISAEERAALVAAKEKRSATWDEGAAKEHRVQGTPLVMFLAPRTDINDPTCFVVLNEVKQFRGFVQRFTDGSVAYWREECEPAKSATLDAALTELSKHTLPAGRGDFAVTMGNVTGREN